MYKILKSSLALMMLRRKANDNAPSIGHPHAMFWGFLFSSPYLHVSLAGEEQNPKSICVEHGTVVKNDEGQSVLRLDGRHGARVIAEPLARVIAAIRITSVGWRSYLPPKTQNLVLVDPAFVALRF